MKKDLKTAKNRIIIIIIIIAAALLVLTFTAGKLFKSYTDEQLYHESVSQLEEISDQMIERLEGQIGLQWGYLSKLDEELIGDDTSLSEEDLAEILRHCEKDMGPAGRQLLFRAVDSDGHYFTKAGRQGMWPGADRLSGLDQQSFLIANWLDTQNYMAFAKKLEKPLSVDGHSISYLVLLRTMEDMESFFHYSAFGDRNIAYIIDYDGTLLSESGSLPDVNFTGRNLFYSLSELTYPHAGSFDSIREEGEPGGTVITDVLIGESRFYLMYNRLPAYDWGIVLLAAAEDVAVSAAQMVNSLLVVFSFCAFGIAVAIAATFIFVTRINRNNKLIELKNQNEQILEESNRLLENANLELQRSQNETEEALVVANAATKAKSQFLANMSHDIRTPMNAIVGITKLMEHDVEDTEKQRYYIKKLQTSSSHMLGLINDILDMSKIESGEVHLKAEPVRMAEQAGQIESIIRSQSNERDQTFTLLTHEVSHEYLIGDGIRIRQVFLNLLTNAVKYTQNGGSISFEITELPCDKPGHASILTSVIDNGYGMTAEFLEQIFEPFTRAENSTTNKVQGTGLGMSITKSLVDLMNGTISVESEPGKGSRFDVLLTLPIDDSPRKPSFKSALLISDDDTLKGNADAAFKIQPATLYTAATADEAFRLLDEENIDVVIFDEAHADMSESLRSRAKDAVLILCREHSKKKYVRAIPEGVDADGFVVRPFFFENLRIAVDQVFEKKTGEAPELHTVLNGKHFLCAEDNELNAEILEALLSMHGATCKIYPDGEKIAEAFEDVRQGDYDAILMDVQMPNMNGMQATRVIRKSSNPLGRTIPIIAMTANAFSSDVEDCLDAGMDAHLAKPLDIGELERTLQELLLKSASAGT